MLPWKKATHPPHTARPAWLEPHQPPQAHSATVASNCATATSADPHRTNRRAQGEHWEQIAADRLQALGLHLLDRNAHLRTAELDLVMQQQDEAVFIEVRMRTDGCDAAAESIGPRKQKRLRQAALLWWNAHRQALHAHGVTRFRIDVVVLDAQGQMKWIKNALC